MRSASAASGWVVPPLRRLTSTAYGRQPPAGVAQHDEVDGGSPDDARAGQLPADLAREARDRLGVRRRGREAAAEVALPVEDLVVGRDDLDVAVRRDLELDARTAHVRPDEPLLDHAAARGEAGQIRVDAHAAGVERHALEPLGDALPLTVSAGRGQLAEVDDGVALAGDAVVELDHHLDELGLRGTQAHDRLDRRAGAGDVRDSQRMRDAGLREQLAAAALRPELLVARVGAVERHVERQRQVALQRGRHVGHQEAERARPGRTTGSAPTGSVARAASRSAGAPTDRRRRAA